MSQISSGQPLIDIEKFRKASAEWHKLMGLQGGLFCKLKIEIEIEIINIIIIYTNH